jgi:hypothetical protein
MARKKYFQTKEFHAQAREWEEKLAASQASAEVPDFSVQEEEYVVRPQVFQKEKVQSVGGLDYYQFCQQVLNEYSFKRDIDRLVFELHTEGKSNRDIEIYLITHSYKQLKHFRIGLIINEIKTNFLRMRK